MSLATEPNPSPIPVEVDSETLARAFPFHIALDAEGRVVRCGESLRKLVSDVVEEPVETLFRVEHPQGMSVERAIALGDDWPVQLRHLVTGVRLRGSFAPTKSGGAIFLGTICANDFGELNSLDLKADSFAPHDPTSDLLHLVSSQRTEAGLLAQAVERLRKQRRQFQESNEQLALLGLVASQTKVAVYVTDSEWRFDWGNEAFEMLSGYSLEEIRGKTLAEVLHGPETNSGVVIQMVRELDKGRSFTTVFRHYRKDGTPFWAEVEVQPVLSENGAPTHFILVERDITENRLAAEKVRRREAILRALASVSRELFVNVDWREALHQTLPDLALAAETDGAFAISLHDEGKKTVATLEAEWVRGNDPRHPSRSRERDWAGADYDEWKSALRAGQVVIARRPATEKPRKRKNRSMAMVPVFVSGELWGSLGFYQFDETREWFPAELEALETAANVLGVAMERSYRSRFLGEANAKLESALDGGGLASCSLNPDLRRIEFDGRATNVLGRRSAVGEVPIDEFDDWVHPEDLFTYRLALAEVLSGNLNRLDSTVRILRDDGQFRWVRMRAQAFRIETSDLGGVVYGTFQEVHDQVLAELQLRRTVSELAEARRKATEAAATVQRELLTKQPPSRLGRFDVSAFSVPSKGADGDFFDVFQIGDEVLDVLVGDVMGKGLTASLISAGFKSQIARTLGLLATGGSVPTASQIMQAVHDRMGTQLSSLECFATVAYVRIDAARGQVELIDCGHTRPAIWSRRTGTVRFIQGDNLPIGIMTGEFYRPVVEPIAPGDLLILYSDGVTDHEVDGTPVDESRLAEAISEAAASNPDSPWQAVEARLRALATSAPLKDDFTCAVIGVPGETRQGTRLRIQIPSTLEQLDDLRAFIAKAVDLSIFGWSTAQHFQFELASSEVFTNIVRHAHANRPSEQIVLEAEDKRGGLEVRFSYSGEPFEVNLPDEEVRLAEGGYGLGIIHRAMDRVECYQDDRGTMWITLWKTAEEPKGNHD